MVTATRRAGKIELGEPMPLGMQERTHVLEYCERHIEPPEWFRSQVGFVADAKLVDEMNLAFYSARHMEKLGEALAVSGEKRHPHLKFQIVQYASIYEAIIAYLLFGRYANHDAVTQIRSEKEYVKVSDVSKALFDKDGDHLVFCKKKLVQRDPIHIRFENKLKAAESIGIVLPHLRPELLALYKTRNAVHLESAARNSVTYEAKQATVAYKRLKPFLSHVQQLVAREDAALTKRLAKNA
jgi:hypothetical protein